MLLSYPTVQMKISKWAIACQAYYKLNWGRLNKESRYHANTLKENSFVFNIFKKIRVKKTTKIKGQFLYASLIFQSMCLAFQFAISECFGLEHFSYLI